MLKGVCVSYLTGEMYSIYAANLLGWTAKSTRSKYYGIVLLQCM